MKQCKSCCNKNNCNNQCEDVKDYYLEKDDSLLWDFLNIEEEAQYLN